MSDDKPRTLLKREDKGGSFDEVSSIVLFSEYM